MDFSDYRYSGDIAEATTLPSRWYTDPAVLAAERKNLFHKGWQYVGSLAWLTEPGSHFATEIQGEPLIVLRDRQGKLRALSNVCRHRAGPLAEGRGCSPVLQCKYHGWTYDLDGRLRAAPEFEGVRNWDKTQVSLPEFRVDTWGPLVFVSLAPTGPGLAETLGAIPGETKALGVDPASYRFLHRRDYLVKCNWKAYVDNYQEGYHIPLAHPALYKEIDYGKYVVENRKTHSRHHTPMKAGGGKQALYYWIFPNLMINVYPDNLSTNLVVPIDEETTLTVFEWFVPKDSPVVVPEPKYWPLSKPLPGNEESLPADLEKITAFSHQVQLEDIYLCESVQRALHSSTYDRGRLSPKRENGVHHFHKLVAEALSQN